VENSGFSLKISSENPSTIVTYPHVIHTLSTGFTTSKCPVDNFSTGLERASGEGPGLHKKKKKTGPLASYPLIHSPYYY